MDNIKILHEAAMEYVDLAKRAKVKGDDLSYKENMEKAYVLEKEAALTMPEQKGNFMWRYILLRSAGWLAFQCEFFQEAVRLAELGLKGNPPAIEKNKLEKLLKDSQLKINTLPDPLTEIDENKILGFLSSVDLIENKIYIKQTGTEEQFNVFVDKEKIREIARIFIGDIVQIIVEENMAGEKILNDIKRAA